MGRTAQWVSALENGKIGAKQPVLRKISEVLGVSIESVERLVRDPPQPPRLTELLGIPIINRAPVGAAWDYEAHVGATRGGHSYATRLPGEDSDDLIAVEVVGDSMLPELREQDLLVLWWVPQGVPPKTIDGRIVLASFTEEHGGGVSLAQLKFTGEEDERRGLRARLVKLNPAHESRDIWLTDLYRLAVAKRIQRAL